MRIVFFGIYKVGVEALAALHMRQFDIVAVVTKPSTPVEQQPVTDAAERNLVRGFPPRPGAWTVYENTPLTLHKVSLSEDPGSSLSSSRPAQAHWRLTTDSARWTNDPVFPRRLRLHGCGVSVVSAEASRSTRHECCGRTCRRRCLLSAEKATQGRRRTRGRADPAAKG